MRVRSLIYVYAVAVLIYLGLTFLLPPDPATLKQYGISIMALRLLSVTIAVPLVLIWLAAFYGYAKLHSYKELIIASKEGQAVSLLSQGLLLLALSLPINAITNALGRYIIRRDPDTMTAMTVIGNLIELCVPLAAFILISFGARKLTELSRQRPSRGAAHGLILLFAIISVAYTYFVVHFAYTGRGDASQAYALPLWLVLLTTVVPYVYMWYIGLVAAYELLLYNSGLKGVLYRKSWSRFSAGIGVIILTLIIVQFMTTMSAQLSRLSITGLLLVVYALLVLMAAGYLLVAYGAKRLQKIEEV